MKVPKQLIVLAAVFVVLVGVAGFLLVRGRPEAESTAPLGNVEADRFRRIVITMPNETVELENIDGAWWLVAPRRDHTDPESVRRLLGTLRSFTLGPVVADRADRFARFEIEAGTATHLVVFGSDANQPLLDGLVGKEGPGWGTSYFRRTTGTDVHVGNDLPSWVIKKPSDDYRMKAALSLAAKDANQIRLASGRTQATFSRSTDSWKNDATGLYPAAGWMNTLVSRIDNLRTFQFIDSTAPLKTGLDQPFLRIAVSVSSQTSSVAIGNKAPSGERYAKTDGRDTLYLLGNTLVDEVYTHVRGALK